MMLVYKCLPYFALSLDELYETMVLRQSVFVVEQNCPYLDADGRDQRSYHLMGYSEDGNLLAYARLLPPGVSYPDYPSIGRVLNALEMRGKGVGRELMQEAISRCIDLFGNIAIKISAQCYLTSFYESFGFVAEGEEYLEDDIPHIAMILTPKETQN